MPTHEISRNTDDRLQDLDLVLANSSNKKCLTNIQELVYLKCWEGCSYQEIANSLGYDCNYIKKIGWQLWRSLSQALNTKVSKSNFQSLIRQYIVEHQLNIVDLTTPPEAALLEQETTLDTRVDWGEASDVSIFYGRQSELDELASWIIQDKCRLVAIFGMGGTGKTAVSIKLAQQIQHHFDYVVWQSLRDSPTLPELLEEITAFIANGSEVMSSEKRHLSQLIKYLKKYRCLIVIDNFETVLQSNSLLGTYRNGYQDYGEFIRRLGDVLHQSCILITSREKPEEIAALQGDRLPVRVCSLKGLDEVAGKKLLQAKGLKIADIDSKQLVESYQGNALAIKIAATAIEDLFAGDITKFLAQETRVFNGLRLHLSRHFERLSDLESQIMYWLAINREPVSSKELQTDIVGSISSSQVLETLEFLIRRSLVERTTNGFTQQPVIMEYVTEKIIETIAEEIISEKISLFNTYALVKPQGKDYLKDSQIRIILEPLVEKLLIHFGSKQQLEKKLKQVLILLRLRFQKGYGAGNIVNIFRYLQTDLTGFDFSYLPIWQADLRNIQLHECNFSHVNFFSSVFAKVFSVVTSVTFSSQGDYLATADTNGDVKIWSVQTGQELVSFDAHPIWVWSIAFSPNDRLLATVADDKLVKLWDVKSGKCLKVFEGHQHSIVKVCFSPDGEFLASSGQDSTIKIWSINQTSVTNLDLVGHSYRIWALAFNSKETIIASGAEDKTIKLWNWQTGECFKTIEGHEGWIKSVAFSPDGQLLASASLDRTIKFWNWQTGECSKTLIGHTDFITEIAFTAGGTKLISSSFDETLRLWDVQTGKCLKVLEGHTNKIWSLDCSNTGELAVSGGDDRSIKLWNLNTGKCNKTFQGTANFIFDIALNFDGKYCVSGHEDKNVRLWNIDTAQCVRTLVGHSNRIWTVASDRKSEEIIASGSADTTIKLWNVKTGKCLQTLQGHQSWVWSLDFSPTQNILASGSYDKTIKLWNIKHGDCIQTLEGHEARINCVRFSQDGQKLISSSFDRAIKLWNVKTGKCLQTLQGHDDNVWSVVFSPCQKMIASCSQDKTIKLWDLATGNCIKTFLGHQGAVTTIAFSADASYLVSGSYDHTIKIWNIEAGNCIKTIAGHDNVIMALAIANSQIITSSWDETIKVWDFATGNYLKTLKSDKLYEKMNITGISGLTEAQGINLKSLGALVS